MAKSTVDVFAPKYSGDASAEFWRAIRAQGDITLYGFACALQDLEGRVLFALANAPKPKRERKAVR